MRSAAPPSRGCCGAAGASVADWATKDLKVLKALKAVADSGFGAEKRAADANRLSKAVVARRSEEQRAKRVISKYIR